MPSLEFRAARRDEYPAFARLYAELRAPESVPSESWLSTRTDHVLLACQGDFVAAYAYWEVYGTRAHVVNVVVDPDRRRRGVARALMEVLHSRLVAAGCLDWYLHVRSGDDGAKRLYETCGLLRERRVAIVDWEWAYASRLPAPSGMFQAFEPTPQDDPGIERALHLDVGRLRVLRGACRTLLGLRNAEGGAVGIAALQSDAGLVAPFGVTHLDCTPSLLAALRPMVPSERARVVTDGDERLTAMLGATGANVVYGLVRMSALLSP